LTTASGAVIGRYSTWNYSNYAGASVIDAHLTSGLKAAENESVTISLTGYGTYTLSGHYAQP